MYLSNEFKHIIETHVKEWLFSYRSKVNTLSAEEIVNEYNRLITSLNELSKFIDALVKDYTKEAGDMLSNELLKRLARASLKDIVKFCSRKEIGKYIIPYLPKEKYLDQVNSLTVDELFYIMRILNSPSDVLWKSCFEELINKLDSIPCQDLFGYFFLELKVNVFTLLRYIKYCPDKELSNYYLSKLINYIDKRLPKCKLNDVEPFLYYAEDFILSLSAINVKMKDVLVKAIMKFLLNVEDIEKAAELITIKPYSKILNYMKSDDVMKIVKKFLNKILQDPLKISAIRILNVIPALFWWYRKEDIIKQWNIDEELRAIWYRVSTILRTTQDFLEYSTLYAKLHESGFTYYLEDYGGIKVKILPLNSSYLKEMLIENLRKGVSYEALANALLNLRKYLDKKTYKRLKSSLKYYHRKFYFIKKQMKSNK